MRLKKPVASRSLEGCRKPWKCLEPPLIRGASYLEKSDFEAIVKRLKIELVLEIASIYKWALYYEIIWKCIIVLSIVRPKCYRI
jgi:hypothetical protein